MLRVCGSVLGPSDGTLPEGVNILVGLRDQKQLDISIQPAQGRALMHSQDPKKAYILHTQPLSKLRTIMQVRPLRYLAVSGSLCGEYHWLRDMGYDFEYFHAIIWDEEQRDVI